MSYYACAKSLRLTTSPLNAPTAVLACTVRIERFDGHGSMVSRSNCGAVTVRDIADRPPLRGRGQVHRLESGVTNLCGMMYDAAGNRWLRSTRGAAKEGGEDRSRSARAASRCVHCHAVELLVQKAHGAVGAQFMHLDGRLVWRR